MKNEKFKPYVMAVFLLYALWVIIFCCLNNNEKSVPLCVGNTIFGLILFSITLYKRKEICESLYLNRLAIIATLFHIFELSFALRFLAGNDLSAFGTLHTGIKVLFIVSFIQTMVNMCCFFFSNDRDFDNSFMQFG